tara:strand:+ start:161 stop:634 length:474 start_codon:yes stop_codon:yes gene_type:complete
MEDNKFNHYKWQREYLGEAPMDKRFAKNFEKDCKALLNHIKSELAKGPKGMQRAQLQLYAKEIAKAMEVPSKLAKIVGMNEDANNNAHQNETVHEYKNGIVEIDSPREALDNKNRQLITGLVENVAMKAIAHFVPSGFTCKTANVEICIKHKEDMDD